MELLRTLLTIREVESYISTHYHENEMKTPMHMSMGSEHIATGVLHPLAERAIVFNSYRSHAPFLARTDDVAGFFLEMYGKKWGPNSGRAGSMHITESDFGHFLSSGIVAAQIPIAVGAAFAEKYNKTNRIAVVFFGDGATNEGVFWESINLACLYRVPVIFVCEDNDLAVHTRKIQRNGYAGSLVSIIENFCISTFSGESTDVDEVVAVTEQAVKSVEAGIPAFIHWKYYRYLEHVGVNSDLEEDYRSIDEYRKWADMDSISVRCNKLRNSGVPIAMIRGLQDSVTERVEAAAGIAHATLPDDDVESGVYCNGRFN